MRTDDLTLPQQIARMDTNRLATYRSNLSFYKGTQWKDGSARNTVDAPWLADESKPNHPWLRRLTLNYTKVLVDKMTSYLMSELNFAVDPADETEAAKDLAKRAEDALYRVYDRNHLAQLDFDTEIDTAVLGDGCYKVTWDPAMKDVRISAPDVQGIFAWWVGDDISRVWRVASRYVLTKDEVAMLHRVKTAKQAATITEVWTDKTFELWADNDLIRSSRNPYGFVPFVIYANLREPKQFWGVSDLVSIVQPARELNRAMTQLSRILELSGNPIAVLENVDKADDITVTPGAVWEIPEKAKAYLLDLLQGGGVKLHADYIDLVYRAIHDLSEMPRTSFGDNQRALSGVALEMELHPLLQKIRRKRLIRAVSYQRRAEMILRLMARFGSRESGDGATIPSRFSTPDSRISIRVLWGDVLPQDRGRRVQEETTLVAAGIHSRRRAADNLGVENPELEFEQWLGEERRVTGGG